MKHANRILWGIVLVAAGILLALNAFEVPGINLFFDGWWTLFIIIPCAIGLFTDCDKTGHLIGVCIGVFLLLCCQDILSFQLFWKLLVPAIIVVVGIRMILSSAFGGQVYAQMEGAGTAGSSGTATFSGAVFDYTGEVFEGTQLDAVFGSIRCDLRGAAINGDCVIDASAIFGGIDIYVPAGLNVIVNSTSLFGGVSGKEHRNDPANQHTLYLNATCLFGGIDLK